jgi:hypothetical protein
MSPAERLRLEPLPEDNGADKGKLVIGAFVLAFGLLVVMVLLLTAVIL